LTTSNVLSDTAGFRPSIYILHTSPYEAKLGVAQCAMQRMYETDFRRFFFKVKHLIV